jgi:hypothetical protein
LRTYLFDASAAVEIYVPRDERTKKILRYIVDQRRLHKSAELLIPSFCIAEVFNTLARKHFGDKSLNRSAYEKSLSEFRQAVHWGNLLYPYELNRYHILAADNIIPVEHKVSKQHDRDHLSTFDILLIAMAYELAFLRSTENVFLITYDQRILRVCEEFTRMNPKNIEELAIPGPTGAPKQGRWYPPRVLYVPKITGSDMTPTHNQPRFNLSQSSRD